MKERLLTLVPKIPRLRYWSSTQAMWLAKRGYKAIGSDLSDAAINRAKNVYANEKNVDFIVDNILNSKFQRQ